MIEKSGSGQVPQPGRVRRPSASPPLRTSCCAAVNRRLGPLAEVIFPLAPFDPPQKLV